MKINLHFLPETPNDNCRVLVFLSYSDNILSSVYETHYSRKWGAFFMMDEANEMTFSTYDINKSVVAWAYFDEIREEFKDEIQI